MPPPNRGKSKNAAKGKKGDTQTKALMVAGGLFALVAILFVATGSESKITLVSTKERGDGRTWPRKGDVVTIHYISFIADSMQMFDSSIQRSSSFEFTVGEKKVLKGWEKAVQQMSLGETSTYRIHSDLAYGKFGIKDKGQYRVPPDTDVAFEITLVAVNGQLPAVNHFLGAVNMEAIAKNMGQTAVQRIQTSGTALVMGWFDPNQDDANDKKPGDWDKPEQIEAQMPDSWDPEEDGEWETQMIPNPEFKGEWKPARIPRPDAETAVRGMMTTLQYEYSNDFVFLLQDASQNTMHKDEFNLKDNQCGENKCWLIMTNPFAQGQEPARYLFQSGNAPPTAGELRDWLKKFKAGTLTKFVKSEDPPAEAWQPGKVRTVVATTMDEEVFDAGKDVLLEFCLPDHPDCKKSLPIIEKLAEKNAADTNVKIAYYNPMTNAMPDSTKFPLQKVPTYFLVGAMADAAPLLFEGAEATEEALTAFLMEKRTSSVA